MKILIAFTLLSVISCLYRFQITVYKSVECLYCRFAAAQIQKIVEENFWGEIIDLVIINCESQLSLCKESMERPIIEIRNERMEKLGYVEGVHSKIYFRDWISGFVTVNPLRMEETKGEHVDGQNNYKRLSVANAREVQTFYRLQLDSLNKISESKLDILKEAFKDRVLSSPIVTKEAELVPFEQQNLQEEIPSQIPASYVNVNVKKEGEVKMSEIWVFVSVCLGMVGVLILGICVGSKYKKNEGIRIPEEEEK